MEKMTQKEILAKIKARNIPEVQDKKEEKCVSQQPQETVEQTLEKKKETKQVAGRINEVQSENAAMSASFLAVNSIKKTIIPEHENNLVIELIIQGKVLYAKRVSRDETKTEFTQIKALMKEFDTWINSKEGLSKKVQKTLKNNPLPLLSNTETLNNEDYRDSLISKYDYLRQEKVVKENQTIDENNNEAVNANKTKYKDETKNKENDSNREQKKM